MKTYYYYGDFVSLTPAANPGWTFTGWGGDVTGSTSPLVIEIQGNTSITANFIQDEYSLSVDVTPESSGTVLVNPVKSTYHYGDQVTLTSTANTGWTFSSWSGDATGSTSPLVFEIQGNTSITANFTQDEYTLAVGFSPEGSGTVEINPVQATYHYGDLVTLTANANAGWTFSSWSGDASSTDNQLTIEIQGNTSITANFIQYEYTLSVAVSPEGSGSVLVDPEKTAYHYGDQVTFTATANAGWTFSGWSGDASGLDNSLTIEIRGNTSITANFTQDDYSLVVGVSPEGSGSVLVYPEKTTYHYGDQVTLTATSNEGWTFMSWSGDVFGTDNSLTIEIQGNTSLSANFIIITYEIYLPLIIR